MASEKKFFDDVAAWKAKDYKLVLIMGEVDAGKSSFGNFYCGWQQSADKPPFEVSNDNADGTSGNVKFVDRARKILWVDTRGLSELFTLTDFFSNAARFKDVNAIVFMPTPVRRLANYSRLANLERFYNTCVEAKAHIIMVIRSNLIDAVRAHPFLHQNAVLRSLDSSDKRIDKWIEDIPDRRFSVLDPISLWNAVEQLNRQLIDQKQAYEDVLKQQATEFARVTEQVISYWGYEKSAFLKKKQNADKFANEHQYHHQCNHLWTYIPAIALGPVAAPALNNQYNSFALRERHLLYNIDAGVLEIKRFRNQLIESFNLSDVQTFDDLYEEPLPAEVPENSGSETADGDINPLLQ